MALYSLPPKNNNKPVIIYLRHLTAFCTSFNKDKSYRESFVRIDLNHAPKKILTIGWHEMGYMKVASLDFFQQLSQIVIVKGKSSDQESVEDHTAWPDICPSAIIFFTLQ